jgi:hypothetical protein
MNSSSVSPDFTNQVKQWVALDRQLKYVNEKTRQIRESKAKLTKDICAYIQSKQWQHRTIDLANEELKFIEKREYSPLSFAFIEECLDEIIADKDQVDFIIDYLKDHRELRVSTEIRRIPRDSGTTTEHSSK